MKIKYVIIWIFFASFDCEGATGGIRDLKWQLFNFIIFSSFVIWQLRCLLSKYFKKKYDKFYEFLNDVEIKSRNIDDKILKIHDRLKNIEHDKNALRMKMEENIERVSREIQNKEDVYIKNLKAEINSRLVIQEVGLMSSGYNYLMEKIVEKTKIKINKNPNIQDKILGNMLEQ